MATRAPATSPDDQLETREPRPLILAGEPVETDDHLVVTFPFDEREVARVSLADADIVERALAAATAARAELHTYRVDHMPYGGERRSGAGREGVRYAIRDFTEERLLVVDPR